MIDVCDGTVYNFGGDGIGDLIGDGMSYGCALGEMLMKSYDSFDRMMSHWCDEAEAILYRELRMSEMLNLTLYSVFLADENVTCNNTSAGENVVMKLAQNGKTDVLGEILSYLKKPKSWRSKTADVVIVVKCCSLIKKPRYSPT